MKKSGLKISVLGPKGRSKVDSLKNIVDVMHKCLLLWEKGRNDVIAEILERTGRRDNPAFKQFCRAVPEYLLNGNKEKQLLEGSLIGIDMYATVEVQRRKLFKKNHGQTDLQQYGG